MENVISLQVLYRELPQLSSQMLSGMGARASSTLKNVTYELPDDTRQDGVGFATFDGHKVKLTFCNRKLSTADAENIANHIHSTPDVEELVADHNAYIDLTYEGEETSPVSIYLILKLLAAMLSTQDALVLANCNARSGLNAAKILCTFAGKDWMSVVGKQPLVYLISGAVVHEVPSDATKAWLRTHGNHLLNVPDLGCLFSLDQQAEIVPAALETFETLMGYMTAIGIPISPGHKMEGETMMITVKGQPESTDEMYQSPSGMLALEFSPKSASTVPPG